MSYACCLLFVQLTEICPYLLISGIRRRLFFCRSGSIRLLRSSNYFGFSDIQGCLELTCTSDISHQRSARLSEPFQMIEHEIIECDCNGREEKDELAPQMGSL